MVTQEFLKEHFTYEDGDLIRKSDGKIAGTDHRERDGNIRRVIRIKGKGHYVYRLVYLWHYGEIPDSIDHADRNQTNDRIENLRPASRSQQRANSKANSNNTSGHRGVYWHKQAEKWQARICANGKHRSLGLYKTKEEAISAHKKASIENFECFSSFA